MAFWQTETIGAESIEFRCLCSIIYALCFCALLLTVGCGSGWRGRIVYLENGKIILQSEDDEEIESGCKILIYREKTIVHPVTGAVLGTIKDDIVEANVLWVRDRTITATANEPYFNMMKVDDQAVTVRGSDRAMSGSAVEVGRISEVDAEGNSVQIAVTSEGMIGPGDALTVIKYAGIVVFPGTGEILAVAVEPVANLKVTEVDADGQLRASYNLVDEKLGWIEIDDVVVKRTGDMITEDLWFQDPPDGFSQAWIIGRSYLRAIRHYDSERYREAILELGDVSQVDHDYRETVYLLGLCYANLNRYEEAVNRFREILKLRPDDAKTWAALAYVQLKQDDLKGVAESYEKLARLLPGDPTVWTDVGDVYRMRGDHQMAEQAYKKALQIDEENEEALYELRRRD